MGRTVLHDEDTRCLHPVPGLLGAIIHLVGLVPVPFPSPPSGSSLVAGSWWESQQENSYWKPHQPRKAIYQSFKARPFPRKREQHSVMPIGEDLHDKNFR